MRKDKRTCTSHFISLFVSYYHLSSSINAFTLSLNSVVIPKFVQEAMSIHDWKSAMEVEMSTLSQNATLSLVTCPPRKTTNGCRLVYIVKYMPDGSIERLKAWFFEKRYTLISIVRILISEF